MALSYRNLPPLSALRAFEAAARHENFTRAADEMLLTQSAISRHVRTLEDHLGTSLFERRNRVVKLTTDGRKLMEAVSMALSHMSTVTQEIRRQRESGKLTVGMLTSQASLYMVPRMSAFRRAHPDLDVHIVSLERNPDPLLDDFDVSIVVGHQNDPRFRSDLLFLEEAFPVCSPDYIDQHGPMQGPADLLDQTLLHLDDATWIGYPWPTPINWRTWLSRYDIELPLPPHGLTFTSYQMVVQAALRGLGIGIGWQHVVSDLIAEGSLVRPIPEICRWDRGHYLVVPSNRVGRADVEAFCDWLKAEVSASVCAPETPQVMRRAHRKR
jgi:LysR family transcriptional regulator, glycine cleavage system transcriptional activator